MSVQVARCTTSELDSVRAIRRAVFVDEQRVPAELELDGLDGDAEHYLARMGDRPVGTARARRTTKGWKLERVAVTRSERGSGVGRALVEHAIAHLKTGGAKVVSIGTGGDDFHAPARALYEELGFTPFPNVNYTKAI